MPVHVVNEFACNPFESQSHVHTTHVMVKQPISAPNSYVLSHGLWTPPSLPQACPFPSPCSSPQPSHSQRNGRLRWHYDQPGCMCLSVCLFAHVSVRAACTACLCTCAHQVLLVALHSTDTSLAKPAESLISGFLLACRASCSVSQTSTTQSAEMVVSLQQHDSLCLTLLHRSLACMQHHCSMAVKFTAMLLGLQCSHGDWTMHTVRSHLCGNTLACNSLLHGLPCKLDNVHNRITPMLQGHGL